MLHQTEFFKIKSYHLSTSYSGSYKKTTKKINDFFKSINPPFQEMTFCIRDVNLKVNMPLTTRATKYKEQGVIT